MSSPGRCFNGAPRLGLGEGGEPPKDMHPDLKLQWGSETGSRRREEGEGRKCTLKGGLQWGSETGSRRRREEYANHFGKALRFNGAPRLGLGEGLDVQIEGWPHPWLQWGSETGSRRRAEAPAVGVVADPASMGLRDWVSEKARHDLRARIGHAQLQWGSETGSRRRTPSTTTSSQRV